MLKNKQDIELLICGAGISGCMAALAAHDMGLHVALVDKRAYPGGELTASNNSFYKFANADSSMRNMPLEFQRIFSVKDNNEGIAPEGYVRQSLLNMLQERDIPVLFESEAVGLSMRAGKADGVLLSSVSGLTWLSAKMVVDAQQRLNLLRIIKGAPYLEAGRCQVHAVFEFEVAQENREAVLSTEKALLSDAEKELDLSQGSIKLHSTIRNDTIAVEFAFDDDIETSFYTKKSEFEAKRQQLSLELALWLKQNVAGLSEARLSHIAYECHISDNHSAIESSVENLYGLSSLAWDYSLDDLGELWQEVTKTISSLKHSEISTSDHSCLVYGKENKIDFSKVKKELYDDVALPLNLYSVLWNDELLPTYNYDCNIFIAGMGTCGSNAAIAAAERGCKVIAAEVNSVCGGTFGPGRVIGFYNSYQGGATGRFLEKSNNLIASKLKTEAVGGIKYSEYILQKADEHKIDIFCGTRVCGVKRDGDKIVKLLLANEAGLFSVSANVSIDCTGEATIAAMAEGTFDIGDPRNGMQQSYSMWGAESVACENWQLNRYQSDPDIISPDVYSERLRAIYLGHKDGSYNHISPMITVRESRRIHGEKSLKMNDVLNNVIPDDVITVATTSCDSHAYLSSDLAIFQYPADGKRLKVRIPYSCFIPKGTDALLVGAKAFSGERDATSLCRMNADIINQGYALGCAAAKAVNCARSIRDIDMTSLQAELKECGILPAWAFSATGEDWSAFNYNDGSLMKFDSLQKMVSASAEVALPVLEKRWQECTTDKDDFTDFTSERSILCMALAYYGSDLGGDYLKQQLEQAIATGKHLAHSHINVSRFGIRDLGNENSDYYIVNRLLVMSAFSKNKSFCEPLKKVIEQTCGLGEAVKRIQPYDVSRKDVPVHPFYNRLRAIAFAAQKLALPELAPSLEALITRSGVRGHSVAINSHAKPSYMLAFLEFSLASAAARCGSSLGEKILREYLEDTHVIFRKAALKLLDL